MDPQLAVLDGSRTAFVEALRRHDANAACAVYADRARLLPPASGAVIGREQIRAFWQAGLNSGIADVNFEPSEFHVGEALTCEVGRYTLRFDVAGAKPLVERGHYIHVHECQPDGTWLRTVEMFTPGGDE